MYRIDSDRSVCIGRRSDFDWRHVLKFVESSPHIFLHPALHPLQLLVIGLCVAVASHFCRGPINRDRLKLVGTPSPTRRLPTQASHRRRGRDLSRFGRFELVLSVLLSRDQLESRGIFPPGRERLEHSFREGIQLIGQRTKLRGVVAQQIAAV